MSIYDMDMHIDHICTYYIHVYMYTHTPTCICDYGHYQSIYLLTNSMYSRAICVPIGIRVKVKEKGKGFLIIQGASWKNRLLSRPLKEMEGLAGD